MIEREPALCEVCGELRRIESERPGFTRMANRRDPAVGLLEPSRPIEHASMDVGEDEPASGSQHTGQQPKRVVDGVGREVVGDALPDRERRFVTTEPVLVERHAEVIALEVDRDEAEMFGEVFERSCEARALLELRGALIDLDHRAAFDPDDAHGAAVEAGTEHQDLADSAVDPRRCASSMNHVRTTADGRVPGQRRSIARGIRARGPGTRALVATSRSDGWEQLSAAIGSTKSRDAGARADSIARKRAMYSAVRLGVIENEWSFSITLDH